MSLRYTPLVPDERPPSADPRQAEIDRLAAIARRKVAAAIEKQRKLIANLHGDLEKHGDPEQWKRYGDLLLANVGTARREGDRIFVVDYFDQEMPTVEIEGDAHRTLADLAEDHFRRYAKARNGVKVIEERLSTAEIAIERLQTQLRTIDDAVERGDIEYLASLERPPQPKIVSRQGKKADAAFKGARRFVSSDGFEILVGKKAADNDFLTFRVARSLDMWLHAADYPGSHVVIRSSGKKQVPDRTLIEAAQLAAFYSDAREQPKAAVRYTPRKFVNKIKGGAPGLVRLASFRTLMVEPRVAVEPIVTR